MTAFIAAIVHVGIALGVGVAVIDISTNVITTISSAF